MRCRALALVCPPVLVVGLVVAGCGRSAGAPGAAGPQAEPVVVALAPVQVRSIPRTIDATGTLFGEEEITISAKLSGRVADIMADVGDPILPGGALARIDGTDYRLALTERRTAVLATLAKIGLTALPPEGFDPSEVPTVVRARAEAANARARLERGRTLYEEDPPLISEEDFADLTTAWEVAVSGAEVELLTARAVVAEARALAAQAAVAEQRLADTLLRAPGRAGDPTPRYRVAERIVSLGEYVTEGRPTFRLVAGDLIKFRADVPERFVGEVAVGQGASVWVEAYDEPVEGETARVSPRIDPLSRTFQVEIHVPNADGRLKPGAFARGRIATRMDEGAAMVPEAAVATFAGVHKVFSVRDGKAVEHRVRLGDRRDGLVEIVGGLDARDVVVSGAAELADGAPVRPAP